METEIDPLADVITKEGTEIEDFDISTLLTEDEQETETPEESLTETKEEEESPSQEGEKEDEDSEESSDESSDSTSDETKTLPFHKNPRWKKMQEKNADLQSKLDDLSTSQTEIKESLKTSQAVELPDWWITLADKDETSQKAFRQYQAYNSSQRAEIKKELMAEQKAHTEEQAKESERWTNWVDESMDALKEEGLKFDSNELKKVAVDFQPLDADGNISLRKAYDILQLQKAAKKDTSKATAKKAVAAKTTSSNRGDSKEEFTPSTNSLRFKDHDTLMRDQGIR